MLGEGTMPVKIGGGGAEISRGGQNTFTIHYIYICMLIFKYSILCVQSLHTAQ